MPLIKRLDSGGQSKHAGVSSQQAHHQRPFLRACRAEDGGSSNEKPQHESPKYAGAGDSEFGHHPSRGVMNDVRPSQNGRVSFGELVKLAHADPEYGTDRKSTRLNSSHV